MLIQPSIQRKVSYGYYLCLALIVVVSVLNYLNLKRIEEKITFNLIISEFFDATLEMRRFEKNYILYKNTDDYNENLKFTNVVEDILRKNKGEIIRFSPATNISHLETIIAEYKLLMNEYFTVNASVNPTSEYILEGTIRASGKAIVTGAEAIAERVRARMQSLIVFSGRLLIASIMFLIVAGCLIGQYLSRVVVRPLKQLENAMQDVSSGHFNSLPITSSDREIILLKDAFSKMIAELDARQMHLIHSEKLASLGTLIFGVTHELNNPLSNISTSCQILKEELEKASPEYKKELLDQIENETDRARDIVRAILDFSRAREKERINLKQTVNESIRFIKAEVPSKIDIIVNIPEDITLFADKQRIQQVFLNLIANSISAIPEEGKISISANANTRDKTTEIKVSDTGVGMDKTILYKVFDPFFTTKSAKKGHGLGLFIVHSIIEEHGGIIEVDSQPGRETTFLIKLPERSTEDGS